MTATYRTFVSALLAVVLAACGPTVTRRDYRSEPRRLFDALMSASFPNTMRWGEPLSSRLEPTASFEAGPPRHLRSQPTTPRQCGTQLTLRIIPATHFFPLLQARVHFADVLGTRESILGQIDPSTVP